MEAIEYLPPGETPWHTEDGHPIRFGATSIEIGGGPSYDQLGPLTIVLVAEHVGSYRLREIPTVVAMAQHEASTVSPSSVRFRRRVEQALEKQRDTLPFCAPDEPRDSPTPYESGAWQHWVANTKPETTVLDEHTASISDRKRVDALQRREDSWQRSDTDGFLSQWASGVTANEASLQAEIDRDGGYSLFPGLYDRKTGERVAARIIDGQWGPCWALCDAAGELTGKFVGDARTKRGKLYKQGFVVLGEWAPAKATVRGEGKGLSGTAWATVVRTDGGYPEGAKVV